MFGAEIRDKTLHVPLLLMLSSPPHSKPLSWERGQRAKVGAGREDVRSQEGSVL